MSREAAMEAPMPPSPTRDLSFPRKSNPLFILPLGAYHTKKKIFQEMK